MIGDILHHIDGLPQDLVAKPLSLVIASVVVVLATLYLRTAFSDSKLTLLNPKSTFDWSGTRSKTKYTQDARAMMLCWFDKNPDKPVSMNTDMGPMTILPASMANEIRNDSRLDFRKLNKKMFHSYLPGFEVFNSGASHGVVQKVIAKDLTHQLTKVTAPLSEETSMALEELVGNDPEWKDIQLKETMLQLIARISSRVFLGEELCRNEDWLKVTKEYTVTAFNAAHELRLYPFIFRPIVFLFLKSCQKARQQIAEARRVIAPVFERREQLKREAAESGEDYKGFNDAIDWFEIEAEGVKYDPAVIQLGLSLAAIHTTTDLVTQTLCDIAKHPEIKDELRQEIVDVIGKEGWSKQALYKMKLLDSTIKESQRIKPISMTSMSRIATAKVVLSDGTVIPKGHLVSVTSNRMWDSKLHADPTKWDPHRFLTMREQPEKQHLARLVTTNPDHLAFGHGQHACPGRFFAANEVKIALITILIKYDIELIDGQMPRVFDYGFSLNADPIVKIKIRRRQQEIQL